MAKPKAKKSKRAAKPVKMTREDAAAAVAKAWLNKAGFFEREDPDHLGGGDIKIMSVDDSGEDPGIAWVMIGFAVNELDIELAQDGEHDDVNANSTAG